MKICSKCKKSKAETEFRSDPKNSDGLRSQCKACQRVTSTESWRRRKLRPGLRRARGAGRGGYAPVEPPKGPTDASCPKCKGSKLIPLAADADKQRFQCANEDCGEHFVLPIELARTVTGERSPLEAPAVVQVLESLDCPNCGKRYQRGGKRRQKHVDNCDGTPLPPREEKPERPKLTPVEDAGERGPTLKQRVIRFIRAERDYHTDQSDIGRRLIDAISEVKEDGE